MSKSNVEILAEFFFPLLPYFSFLNTQEPEEIHIWKLESILNLMKNKNTVY